MNLKKTVLTIIPVVGLLLWRVEQAQGTVYSSNLGNTPSGTFSVANNSWIAQEFVWEGYQVNGVMLTPACSLNSVELMMAPASGSPSGFTVSIYSAGASGPGTRLGTLTGDSNPNNGGVYTYTTPGILLSPATSYLVVVDSATPSGQAAYNWSTTTSASQISQGLTINNVTGYLRIEDVYYDSADGLSWNYHLRQDIGQMAIYGTPVPEPSLGLLVLCGMSIVRFVGRRWKSASSGVIERGHNKVFTFLKNE